MGTLKQGAKGPKGDNGKDGTDAPGAVKDNCVLGEKHGDSYDILCGTTSISVGGNGGGAPAGACVLGPEGSNTLICDGKTVSLGSGSSGGTLSGCTVGQADKYNKYELAIKCANSDTVFTCHGFVFNKKINACHNGFKRKFDTNCKTYDGKPTTTCATADETLYGGDLIGLYDSDDKPLFQCDKVQYDPNKQFCKGTELADLCGGEDFDGADKFCFKSKSDYRIVLDKCGNSDKKTFENTQFCPVKVSSVDANGNVTFTRYSTVVSPTVYPATLCGGIAYDGEIAKVNTSSYDEISSISLTGGEYYEGAAAKTGGWAVDVNKGSAKAYIYGSSICQGSSVMTKCAKNATQDTLLFNATTQFCRDKNADSVEVATLCKKTGVATDKGKTYSKDYVCDPTTGSPSKSCGGTLFDDDVFFCYPGDIKTPYCKDNRTNYNPAQAFCSYGGTIVSDGGTPPQIVYNAVSAAQEVPRNKCGGKTLNVGEWKWEYCITTGTGANDITDVLACGELEQPLTAKDFKCKCISSAVRSFSTKKCIEPAKCAKWNNGGSLEDVGDEDGVCKSCYTVNSKANPVYNASTGLCEAIPNTVTNKIYNQFLLKYFDYDATNPDAAVKLAQVQAACGAGAAVADLVTSGTGKVCGCPAGSITNPWSANPSCVAITATNTGELTTAINAICGTSSTNTKTLSTTLAAAVPANSVCSCGTDIGITSGKCE